MIETKQRSFLSGIGRSSGSGAKRLFSNFIFNFVLLTLSACVICFVTLLLATGTFGDELFFDYFKYPLLLLLNFLPIFLLAAVGFCLTNRVWAGFLVSAAVFVTGAIGNYYKLKFRSDPFMFSDMTAIHTAMGVASGYDLTPGKRIIFCLVCVAVTLLLLIFFARGRCRGRVRAAFAAAIIIALFPLWRFVYSSSQIYNGIQNYEHINHWLATESFISRGFVYPFIYSYNDSVDAPPDGYDAGSAAAELSNYSDADIPADRKVNILAIQLEAFSDFTALGIPGIEQVYEPYHELESESYTGNLITNIFAGGTIDTERCFLTGSSQLKNYRANTNSYVWYLRDQGFATNGSHPCYRSFYNRYNVNRYLGFEDYYYTEGYYDSYSDSISPDSIMLPEVYKIFSESVESGAPVFSFHVTYQGHGPYSTDSLIWGDPLFEGDVSDYSYNVLNNYLGSVKDTIGHLLTLKAQLEAMDEPVVLVLYGDHKPWLGDNNSVYNELGISLDVSAAEGFMNYYSTRYLIWANAAAKEAAGSDFVGEGPDISPCYLMNELFGLLGWDGPAYMQYKDDVRSTLPVVNTSGFYLENGSPVKQLSPDAESKKQTLDAVEYYMRNNFIYTEAAS